MYMPKSARLVQSSNYMPSSAKLVEPEKPSIGGFLNNVVGSAGNLVGNTATGIANIFNPDLEQNTIANVGRLGLGAVESFIPGEQGHEKYAKGLVDFYIDRYGGGDKILKTLYEDPVGVLADASTVLGGSAGVAKLISRLGGSAKAAQVANVLSKASKYSDPFFAASKGAGLAAKPVSNIFKNISKGEKLSDRILTGGLGNPIEQSKIAQKFGITGGELIKKYDLFDRTPEAAKAARTNLMNLYDDIALKSGKKVQTGNVIKSIDEAINKLQSGSGRFSESVQNQIAELTRRKGQLIEALGGTETQTPLMANLEDVTNFRRQALDPDIPQSMFGLDPRGSGKAMGAKQMRDILRKNINSTDPRLERLGMDYGALKKMEKIFSSYQARSGARQPLNFSKLGTAGVGGLVGGLPGAIAGYAGEQIINSPQFLKVVSKVLSKIENLGDKTKYRIPKAEFLTNEERAIEEIFSQDILDNPDKYRKMIKNKFGNYVNTDDIRTLEPIYDKNKYYSAGVHEPASWLTKDRLNELNANPNLKNVLITSGGTGAGKTTGFTQFDELAKLKDKADYIYDTNFADFGKASNKIDDMLARGKNVSVAHTYAHPIKATERMISRAQRTGRTVPIDTHINTYKSNEVIGDLSKKYGGKANFVGVDNTGAVKNRKIVDTNTFKVTANPSTFSKRIPKMVQDSNLSTPQKNSILGIGRTNRKTGFYTRSPITTRSNVFKIGKASRMLLPQNKE